MLAGALLMSTSSARAQWVIVPNVTSEE